ncbi:hypothetical protein [Rhizobium sp. C4]|uniref:hypothetical protein n=1 Tax=Rhizobium sp. C4 TaxID=1349800 RepID=UPI001E46C78C|nr:hypothetical protein [Rhizobium sp. C4]MCD2173512.1 hypothetical protein [Rhizobium sp. C4]
MSEAVVAVRLSAIVAATVFAAGFAFGILRIWVVAPLLGPLTAVVLEVPLMLLIAWGVILWLDAARILAPSSAILMGVSAFILLQAGETLFSGLLGPGNAFAANVQVYWADRSPERWVGFLGQVLFSTLPYIQVVRFRRHER